MGASLADSRPGGAYRDWANQVHRTPIAKRAADVMALSVLLARRTCELDFGSNGCKSDEDDCERFAAALATFYFDRDTTCMYPHRT